MQAIFYLVFLSIILIYKNKNNENQKIYNNYNIIHFYRLEL